MLKIWGRNTSSNVMKVMWTVAELGLEHERIDIGGPFGGNDKPEYLAMNPNGVVPTLQDGGLTLWESNVIVRYLAAKHDAGGLWPVDPAERADVERWMDWQQTVVGPAFGPIFWGLVRTPPEKQDRAAIDRAAELTGERLAMLDRHLAGRAFVGGDRLTIGDIPMCGIIHRWFNLDVKRPNQPSLRAWYDRLCERPGFKRHIVDIPII